MTSAAQAAMQAIVEAGARLLVAEPWRVARILRGANDMTLDELIAEAARRGSVAPADFNRAVAFAQLARALRAPQFAAAWNRWRSECAASGG